MDGFVAKYTNQPVDTDHAYGDQCWDLVAQYCQEVIGIPRSQSFGLPTGPDLDARNIWEYFKDPLPQYFDKVQAPFQQGDIIIWGTAIGKDGHVDIFLQPNGSGFIGFDQNWPIGSFAHQQSHNYTGILGGLRPKKGEPMPNEGDVQNAYLKANGRKATAEEIAVYTSKPWSAPDGLLYGKVYVDLVNAKASQVPDSFTPYSGAELFVKK